MTQEEIDYNIKVHATYNKLDPSKLRAIPKSELIIGQTYNGECRNSGTATWMGDHFEYERFKFGTSYIDTINHFEDDDGFDVFVPIEEKKA